jgi:hypothetical protein
MYGIPYNLVKVEAFTPLRGNGPSWILYQNELAQREMSNRVGMDTNPDVKIPVIGNKIASNPGGEICTQEDFDRVVELILWIVARGTWSCR